MVVGKLMRWSPTSSSSKKKKKTELEVMVAVARLEGLSRPMFGEGDVVAVGVGWNGPPSRRSLGKKKKRGNDGGITGEAAVSAAGVADFGKGAGFGHVCCGSGSDPDALGGLGVCFTVLHGTRDEWRGHKEKKLQVIGKFSINLGEWLKLLQSAEQNGVAERKKPQVRAQWQQLGINLEKDGLTSEAILLVKVSIVETGKNDRTIEAHLMRANEGNNDQVEETDYSCSFNSGDLNLEKLAGDGTDKTNEYNGRIKSTRASTSGASSSESSSPEQFLRSASKRSFFSWGRRSKVARSSTETRSSPINSMSREPAGALTGYDPIGGWEDLELISRDLQTKLKSQVFFASIDQRDESAGGESACSALVVVIANALHLRRDCTSTRFEFDALIREGSSEWQSLCNNAEYIDRFPNKHFDLDSILEARIRSISVVQEKSFVGFFQPESFESLKGATSFDDIWNEISNDQPRTYIVSWNDHFFTLKVDVDAYYIIDTLGERLFEGCTKAYMLKFDDSTEMYRILENKEDEVICRGKESCREFIKRFFAAITLREELEMEEKGIVNTNNALHQRLQIEFHLTEASTKLPTVNDIDWW